MREVVLESRACGVCGAGFESAHEAVHVYAVGSRGVFFRESEESFWKGVPRERSGLAYAAGYAGVLSLFGYSFMPLTLSGWWPAWALGMGFVLALSLLGPLALVLSFAAAVSLDRSPEKSGRLPALVGFSLGWCGSYTLLFVFDEVWRRLAALS